MKISARKMSDTIQKAIGTIELAVLYAISQGYGDFDPGETFWHFSMIERETGLSRDYVRAACRSLTDQGLAHYSRGLTDCDGLPAGAGYSATRKGLELLKSDPANLNQGEADV